MHVFSSIGRGFKYTSETVFSYSIPNSPAIAAFAFATGWYSKRIVLTYGPGALAHFFMSKAYLGSPFLGKVVGGLVVAPVMVPSMIPMIATGTLLFTGWSTCVICNIIARKVFNSRQNP